MRHSCADKAKECQWTIAAGKKCALGIKKKNTRNAFLYLEVLFFNQTAEK